MQLRSMALLVSAAVFTLGLSVHAQDSRKPGLWEVTTTMTWQQTPFPPGMTMPPAAAAAFGGAPHTTQYCLTQAMIDKYGAPMPESRGRCQVANVQKTGNGMTADWICTGAMSGKGTIESHWSNDGTSKGKVHFVGSMQAGPNPMPIEWTSESSSVYKGADCGSVKPPQMPSDN
jgi:hypothetical protein